MAGREKPRRTGPRGTKAEIDAVKKRAEEAGRAVHREQDTSVINLAQTLGEIGERETSAHLEARLGFLERQVERLATRRDEADRAIQAELSGTPIKLVTVDLYAAIEQYDSKHHGDSRSIEVKRAGKLVKRITNLPFASSPLKFQGGIAGLDNMHPSAIGYAAIANEMIKAYNTAEEASAALVNLPSVYWKDSLLRSPPRSWEPLNSLVSTLVPFFM